MASPRASGIPCVQVHGGVHWLRIQVPRDLRASFGKREVLRFLRTRSHVEAKARACRESADRSRIDALRRKLAEDKARTVPKAPTALSDAEIWGLAVRWFVDAQRTAQHQVLEPEAVGGRLEDRDFIESVEFASPYVIAEAENLLASEGLGWDGAHPSPRPDWLAKLHRILHQAAVEHERRLLNRVAGLNLGLDPAFTGVTALSKPPEVKPVAKITLSRLMERFAADPSRARSLSPKSELKRAAQFDLFKSILGADMLIENIDRERAREVQHALTRLPANAGKKFPGRSMKQLLLMPPDPKHPPMAAFTINTYLTAFSSLMRYAMTERMIDHNPAEGLRVAGDGVAAKDRRDPIITADLNKIFSAPLFQDAGQSPAAIRPGRVMVPLVGLFTGMRLNEICQLTADDIVTRDGVDFILVRSDPQGEKRVKTSAEQRVIPIHPELKNRLGFIRHVEAIRQRIARRPAFSSISQNRQRRATTPTT